MQIIADNSDSNLAVILKELRKMTPDALGYSELQLILPKRLGDLEKPESLEQLNERIERIKQARDMLAEGLITSAEYSIVKANILSQT
jgi:hypothetical protein